jgi:hypothetical protein
MHFERNIKKIFLEDISRMGSFATTPFLSKPTKEKGAMKPVNSRCYKD